MTKTYSISINNFVPLLCEGDSAAEAVKDFLLSETFTEELNRLCDEDHAVDLRIREETR